MPLAPTVRKQSSISALCFNALFDHCHFLYSPFAYVDPLHCNMAYLYLELLKDSLNEYAYAAELAGLNYDLQNTVYGMYVSIHSPSSSYCIPDLTPHPTPNFFSARPGFKGITTSIQSDWTVYHSQLSGIVSTVFSRELHPCRLKKWKWFAQAFRPRPGWFSLCSVFTLLFILHQSFFPSWSPTSGETLTTTKGLFIFSHRQEFIISFFQMYWG